jgi:hypothetical protein
MAPMTEDARSFRKVTSGRGGHGEGVIKKLKNKRKDANPATVKPTVMGSLVAWNLYLKDIFIYFAFRKGGFFSSFPSVNSLKQLMTSGKSPIA